MDKAIVGYEADVTFDSLPDQTFTGHIIEVNPSLQSVSGVSAVLVMVQLDGDFLRQVADAAGGLERFGGGDRRAHGECRAGAGGGLREISPGEYAVFVMENGEPRLHLVSVGLQDYTYAEITSGVNAGDTRHHRLDRNRRCRLAALHRSDRP